MVEGRQVTEQPEPIEADDAQSEEQKPNPASAAKKPRTEIGWAGSSQTVPPRSVPATAPMTFRRGPQGRWSTLQPAAPRRTAAVAAAAGTRHYRCHGNRVGPTWHALTATRPWRHGSRRPPACPRTRHRTGAPARTEPAHRCCRRAALEGFLRQYRHLMQTVLLVAGVVSLFLPHQLETAIVLMHHLLNAAMGLNQVRSASVAASAR